MDNQHSLVVKNGEVYEKTTMDNLSHLHDQERLVSKQTSKWIVEVLAPEGPCRGKDVARLP